jgi:predicted DNA-binding transcriptional regulator AlpA
MDQVERSHEKDRLLRAAEVAFILGVRKGWVYQLWRTARLRRPLRDRGGAQSAVSAYFAELE